MKDWFLMAWPHLLAFVLGCLLGWYYSPPKGWIP